MKIIGEGANSSFIVQMEESELRELCGVAWNDRGTVRIGATLAAAENSRRVRDIRYERDECQRLARNLRSLADLLDGELADILPPREGDAE